MNDENKEAFCREMGKLIGRYTRESDVESITYRVDGCVEYADIRFINGHTRSVNVTGDSCLAILHDVYRALI